LVSDPAYAAETFAQLGPLAGMGVTGDILPVLIAAHKDFQTQAAAFLASVLERDVSRRAKLRGKQPRDATLEMLGNYFVSMNAASIRDTLDEGGYREPGAEQEKGADSAFRRHVKYPAPVAKAARRIVSVISTATDAGLIDLRFTLGVLASFGLHEILSALLLASNQPNEAVLAALDSGDSEHAIAIADDLDRRSSAPSVSDWPVTSTHWSRPCSYLSLSLSLYLLNTQALQLAEEGRVRILELLPVLPEMDRPGPARDLICSHFLGFHRDAASEKDRVERSMTAAKRIRSDLEAVRDRRFVVNRRTSRCSHPDCSQLTIAHAFVVFPCGHTFHERCLDCIVSDIPWTPFEDPSIAKERESGKDKEREREREEAEREAEREREKARLGRDNLISECPFCGDRDVALSSRIMIPIGSLPSENLRGDWGLN
ncbi:hypothetical protein KIPB_006121, partial [Kipferlia bialata]